MNAKILVAGASGHLGEKIIRGLLDEGADVRAVIRPNTALEKIGALKQYDIGVIQTDMHNINELTLACKDVDCVVSALQGLEDVIIDVQSVLLQAAVNAGVPRFIPSDYASDFTKQAAEENRNFDLRRKFHEQLEKAPIAATSILNGAFAEILMRNNPLLDLHNNSVSYWEDENKRIDFTTMDDVASYTAAAAMDATTPRFLRIAGFQVSPKELATIAGELKEQEFKLIRQGSLEDLMALIKHERAAHPEGENELYPAWQQLQYMKSMFSTELFPLNNRRYTDIQFTGAKTFISTLLQTTTAE
ncbi:Nucleoside-diphosphate-sugar epimerase [Chitinophaga sp. YR627]|uniref:NmrA family NAD(P)-binding protein n=1 Tax=Chitinophaga sp. YR627 TaxID=1881041 RepID=UPI0008E8293B|nr:NmrA family NAD(P)-binding protein [Chitinophaga sp. YR627]SFN36747.1 Nucleoside-diphosphate-sugar epimerase [Chitinophaga sp. YR627]